jgi:hypothetical protein
LYSAFPSSRSATDRLAIRGQEEKEEKEQKKKTIAFVLRAQFRVIWMDSRKTEMIFSANPTFCTEFRA